MKENKYFVVGFRRYKTVEEFKNKVVGHNHRNKKYLKTHKNIDWNRTDKNIILTDLQFKNLDELLDFAKQNLSKGKRQLKKGAAWGFEIVVDCTPDKSWSEDNYIRYLKDAEQYFKKRFKGLKVISSVIHMDEGKPHLHIVFSYFNEIEGQWYQRKLKEKKLDRLKDILKDFEKEVGKKYGLERGKGKELNKPLKAELAKKIKQVKIKEGPFKIEEKKVIFVSDAAKAIRNINNNYKKALYENEHLKEQLIEHRKKIKDLENKLLQSESKVQELEKENLKLEKEKKRFLKAIDRIKTLEKELKSWKQIALQEREKRLNKQIPERLKEKTLEKIKKDYNLSI